MTRGTLLRRSTLSTVFAAAATIIGAARTVRGIMTAGLVIGERDLEEVAAP